MEPNQYQCKRCRKKWWSPVEVPKVCKHCNSPLWNTDRKRGIGGGRPAGTGLFSDEPQAAYPEQSGRLGPVRILSASEEIALEFDRMMSAEPEAPPERMRQQAAMKVKAEREKRALAELKSPESRSGLAPMSIPKLKPGASLDEIVRSLGMKRASEIKIGGE